MDHSDVIILLARQRSGTNALRAVLETHPEIFCVPEIFTHQVSPSRPATLKRSYFTFLERQTGATVSEMLRLATHDDLFFAFLEYLREFSKKRLMVIDVKYNQARALDRPWQFITDEPALFHVTRVARMRVLNLTRRNYLRYYLSHQRARTTGQWHAVDAAARAEDAAVGVVADTPSDEPITLDIPKMMLTLQRCAAESTLIAEAYARYEHYFTFDYEDLVGDGDGTLSEAVLTSISEWLQVDNAFGQRRPRFRKRARSSLAETIANFDDVERALRETEFEYCLDDERCHRG